MNPNDPAALCAFGRWWAFRGFDDWAIEFFEASRRAGGDVPSLPLARCYWKLKRYDQAGTEFRRAIERKEAPEPYLRLCVDALTRESPPHPSS
jgi:hypothetical protein